MPMMPRLLVLAPLVLAMPALLAATAPAQAESIPMPGAPPAPGPAPAAAPAPPAVAFPPSWAAYSGAGQRFMVVAAGAAVGALMPQLTVVDGLVLMSSIMGGMIADMAYDNTQGPMQK
jgi:hypothetical protein